MTQNGTFQMGSTATGAGSAARRGRGSMAAPSRAAAACMTEAATLSRVSTPAAATAGGMTQRQAAGVTCPGPCWALWAGQAVSLAAGNTPQRRMQ